MRSISASGLAQRTLGSAFLKTLPPPARSPTARGATISTTAAARMESGGDGRFKDPGSIPEVAKLRQLVAADAADGWENSWRDAVTPWDLGQPTPVISHLLETGTLPRGRVLIPGCGSGYDVVALASPERYVVGLDISESATKKAKEWSSSLPNSNFFSFLTADFFNWHPTESFDLIFDYTFFCAIDPCMRAAWASKMKELLNPDGELITLIYPIGDYAGGPPYCVNVTNYEEVLNPVGFRALSIVDNDLAVQPRKGREKLGRWKRCASQSHL